MDTGVVHYCCCQRNSGTDWSVNICGRTHDTHTHVLVLDINAVSAQLRNTHTEINDKFALLEDLWMRRFRRRPLCHWTCGTDKLLSRERKIKQTNRSLLYIRNGMFTVVVSCPYKILRKHVERTHTHTNTTIAPLCIIRRSTSGSKICLFLSFQWPVLPHTVHDRIAFNGVARWANGNFVSISKLKKLFHKTFDRLCSSFPRDKRERT